MITYEYECTNCKHNWSIEQKIVDGPITICPHCHQDTAKRLISGGTGFILQGSCWYSDGYSSHGAKQ